MRLTKNPPGEIPLCGQEVGDQHEEQQNGREPSSLLVEPAPDPESRPQQRSDDRRWRDAR